MCEETQREAMAEHLAGLRRVLILAKPPALRARLQALLVANGFRAQDLVTLEEPSELLRAVDQHEPDLVIVDATTGDADQFAIGVLSQHPTLPVVALGVLDRDDGAVHRIVDHGAYGVLAKPVQRAEVADLVDQLQEETGRSVRIVADSW